MKSYIIIILIIFLLPSCEQEEVPPFGSLTITFEEITLEARRNITLSIYAAEYLGAPLHANLKPNNQSKIIVDELNHGTYVYVHNRANCSSCLKEVAFQINAGRHKNISIPQAGGWW